MFQRNYTVSFKNRKQTILDGGNQILEIPTEGRGGYITMTATGFSFFNELKIYMQWVEDDEPKEDDTLVSPQCLFVLYLERKHA